ncbi:hypothetical protein NKJ64_16185 [Mesorhizobium sp. M0062]|uniref:hypothetical protein n=1 Tax=Mesorhizobium sp. M0062 TaxID=2956867 RepID=UPI003337AE31
METGEFNVDDSATAARAVHTAFTPFLHPILIERCLEHGEMPKWACARRLDFA